MFEVLVAAAVAVGRSAAEVLKIGLSILVGKDDTEEFIAADVSLVAFGVSKDATPEQLKEFVEGKEVTVIGIEKLTKEDAETRTNTFKVVVKLSDYEKAMKPEVWPYRVGVRHYKPPRRNAQGMSWKQQSQQTGGKWEC